MIIYFLVEGFETVVLPRTVTRRWRFTSAYYRFLWRHVWTKVAKRIDDDKERDNFLSIFGPISLILLLGLWAVGLITGFALVEWGFGPGIVGPDVHTTFLSDLYFSGTTFFTLGYGDFRPDSGIERLVAIVETGTGFGFLAIIIGYLPVLYGQFSKREASVSLLDARAGSPPTALEMIRRHASGNAIGDLQVLLKDLERWSAEVLESTLSYPVLAFYRSQHDDQSWISALMVAMDTSALILTGIEGVPTWQAQLTFAMGRHALVDLCLIFNQPPAKQFLSRLTPADMERMTKELAAAGVPFEEESSAPFLLSELRRSYEPYAITLARMFQFTLPPWAPIGEASDDWQRSAWEHESHF